jgi:hypothetical protein
VKAKQHPKVHSAALLQRRCCLRIRQATSHQAARSDCLPWPRLSSDLTIRSRKTAIAGLTASRWRALDPRAARSMALSSTIHSNEHVDSGWLPASRLCCQLLPQQKCRMSISAIYLHQ